MLAGLAAIGMWSNVSVGADDDGWQSIFDGKTLAGWDGNPDFWSVQDGCITGQTTAEKPTKGNTFIIWRKGELADFELKLEYKIVGGNSGIQYRSFEVPNEKWVIGGYQGDFEAGDTYSGILYGERYRGILCNRGQKMLKLFRLNQDRARIQRITVNPKMQKMHRKILIKTILTLQRWKRLRRKQRSQYRLTGLALKHPRRTIASNSFESQRPSRPK